MKCLGCAFENRENAHYCRKCGQSLKANSTTATNSEAADITSRSHSLGSGLRKDGNVIQKVLNEAGRSSLPEGENRHDLKQERRRRNEMSNLRLKSEKEW